MTKLGIMPAGRPAKFGTVEEFEDQVQAYFDQFRPHEDDFEPENNEYRPTITGLCLFLGFESRQSFHDYAEKVEFSYALKKSRFRIENIYEQMLSSRNPAGAIFALKNMGWKDKQEIEQSGGIKIGFADPGDYIYPSQDQSDSGIPESL